MQLPSVVKYTVSLIGIVSVFAFLHATYNHDMWIRQLTKPWPVVALILLIAESVLAVPHRTNISILAALVFCLLGDILLEIDGMFLHGLIAFLIGHVAYIYAFGSFCLPDSKLVYAPFFLYTFAFYALVLDSLGDLKVPVFFYTIILALMAGGAAGTFSKLRNSVGSAWALMLPLGASLFVFSDSLIAINRFYDPNTWYLRYTIIITYWAGQLLMTLSALKILESRGKSKKLE